MTTLTDGIRERLRAYMGPCKCCGKTGRSYRQASAELGVVGSVLHRFLRGGGVDSNTLDLLDERLPRGDKPIDGSETVAP